MSPNDVRAFPLRPSPRLASLQFTSPYPALYVTQVTIQTTLSAMHLLCHTRLLLAITLPTLALYLAPKTLAEEDKSLTERIQTRLASLRAPYHGHTLESGK
jgi:hypothetical protein